MTLHDFNLLDHGYVDFVEHWGSDERIIEAARMSTSKGFLGWGPKPPYRCVACNAELASVNGGPPATCILCGKNHIHGEPGDEKLLRHMWKGDDGVKHSTPFEMCGAVFEVQAPIFVFRQWHRHRTQSVNEFSARYSEMPEVFYVPDEERWKSMGQKSNNKQSSVGQPTMSYVVYVGELREQCQDSYATYQRHLQGGVARECARFVLHTNWYSKMRVCVNLWNWLSFLKKRCAPHAQWEIRQYANAIHEYLSNVFPRTLSLFDEEMANKA